MKNYDHKKIEKKWQRVWEKSKIYEAKTGSKKKKFYGLIEFPYPSGAGLHVGHIRSNTAMDIITRKRRMEGYNVLYPIGWDAFGLPTENYAIKMGIEPAKVTKTNTDIFRKQLKSVGFGFDWSREINTTDPAYYKWTQWIFLQMFKKGLAYKKKTEINWCPSCKIGLANEEVVGGLCDRCGGPTGKKEKEQWMLAITKYADRLDKDLDDVNYLEKIKIQQRNWIGKSEGSEIEFKLVPEESEEINKHTHDLIRYKSKIDSFIKENHLKAAYSGGLSIGSFIGKIYRNHEDIDICPLDSDSFKKLKNFLLTEGFIQSTEEGKDEKHFLKFQKEDIKIDLIEVGIDLKKGIYDLEKGKPDYWDASSDKIIEKDGVFYFDPNLVCKLKFRGIEKDLLDKKIAEIFTNKNINVFTTRADTIFGATYVVLAPEHELVTKLKPQILNLKEVENYIKEVKNKPDIERTREDKVKTGVELKGIKAINPANKEEISVWIADYVLATYGTGAIMAVPQHDERDRDFATKFNLPIIDKPLVDAIEITKKVGGKIVTKYKLRDWVFSRQRYWGEPIPIIHCEECGYVPVPEKDLPVLLPKVKSYIPTDNGESPLAIISKWVNTTCPKCKGKAKRETDTMPNWAGSSWYFLRYADPKNKKEFASKIALKYWMKNGVDWYNGGMEHTTLHLLYSRFWHKFLYDLKLVPTSEPYMKRTAHGMILAEGGVKMSKSIGNTIDPKDIVALYGADTLRIYEMFIGPFDQSVAWSTESIIGSRRFLDKVWRIGAKVGSSRSNLGLPRGSTSSHQENLSLSASFQTLLHKTIKKITEDIESMSFNTAISSMMILINEMEKMENISKEDFKMFLQILAPFAPHITEELWDNLNFQRTSLKGASPRTVLKSIHLSSWPKWDKKKIIDEMIKIVIQVNGKVRAEIMIPKDITEEKVKDMAFQNKDIITWIENKEIKRVIYVPSRVINIVVS